MPSEPLAPPSGADFVTSWARIMRAEGVSRLVYGGWDITLEPRPAGPVTPEAATHPFSPAAPFPHTLPAPPPMAVPPGARTLAHALPLPLPIDDDDPSLAYDSAGPPRSRL